VIVIDTHIWIWWVQGDSRLLPEYTDWIAEHESTGIAVSAISCWEVAKLVEYGRLTLSLPVKEWLTVALGYPGVFLQPLTPDIVVDATSLPPGFHRDPADQIIVATARTLDCPLVTQDHLILAYPHVNTTRTS
jgi:PIN domain nuclease of toxin-antitoxin system